MIRTAPRLKRMNATESDYALVLEARKRRGEIREYHYEGVTFKLADDTRYTPDFFVVTAEWFAELHEVKGFMRDDARVKMKVCARTYPFPLYLVKRKGSGWDVKLVEP